MDRYELGKYLYKRTLDLFRLRQPENFKRVWEYGKRPKGGPAIPRQEAERFPYTGGRSIFMPIGKFMAHLSNGQDGQHLWVGHQDGPGVLVWDPNNEDSQCLRDAEAPELMEELGRALILDELAGL